MSKAVRFTPVQARRRRGRAQRPWPACIAAVVAASAAVAPPAWADTAVSRGAEVARVRCAACHAIGSRGASPHREAPPFRTLHKRYPVETLEEGLVEGIFVGHPDMPAIELPAEQAQDLIAYLKSVQPQARRPRR